ncbi:MAG TPA: hypothetical protein VHK45_03955 [Geminicoccaceae bacterium]|jgi:hypothetical protein|nr:hypothetical protein [Geminicoccaceae bacterium]
MALRKVRLELARTAEFPEGSAQRGYEFVAPLTDNGHLDDAEWRTQHDACTVHRFWAGENDEYGRLVHHGGQRWAFWYDPLGDEGEEPIFRFDRHSFVEGEYVSITEHDGVQRTFRVTEVVPVP